MGITVENIGVPVNETSIGQWVKRQTIAVAERVLREEVGKGFDNEPVVVTDGVTRRDYNDVRPYGKIEFSSHSNMAEVVTWTLDELRKISPILTGRYVASHIPLINGQPIAGNIREALNKAKPGDRVMIVNYQPYAGKIEGKDAYTRWEIGGGKRSRRAARKRAGWSAAQYRGQSAQAKSGVYRKVLFKIVNRFGRAVAADYRPVPLPMGIVVMGKAGGGSKKRIARAQVYPAFIFMLWGRNTLN